MSNYERDDDGFLTPDGVREYLVFGGVGERRYQSDPIIHALVEKCVSMAHTLKRTEEQLPEGVTPYRKKQQRATREMAEAMGLFDELDK